MQDTPSAVRFEKEIGFYLYIQCKNEENEQNHNSCAYETATSQLHSNKRIVSVFLNPRVYAKYV